VLVVLTLRFPVRMLVLVLVLVATKTIKIPLGF